MALIWSKYGPKMAKNGPKMAQKVTGDAPKNPKKNKNRKNGQNRSHRAPPNCTKKSKNALKMSKKGQK